MEITRYEKDKKYRHHWDDPKFMAMALVIVVVISAASYLYSSPIKIFGKSGTAITGQVTSGVVVSNVNVGNWSFLEKTQITPTKFRKAFGK